MLRRRLAAFSALAFPTTSLSPLDVPLTPDGSTVLLFLSLSFADARATDVLLAKLDVLELLVEPLAGFLRHFTSPSGASMK